MATYVSPQGGINITFPQTFSVNNQQSATINRDIISQSPVEFRVYGTYNTSVVGGGGDALHSFQTRTVDGFGGRMNDAITLAMYEIYELGFNPYVKSLTVKFSPNPSSGPNVEWEAILTESPDGKAYVGFNSRGGAGNVSSGTAVERAQIQTTKKKKSLPDEVNPKEPNMESLDVLDYRNEKAVIRQIFWQYTRPKAYPPKVKSDNIKSDQDEIDDQKKKEEFNKIKKSPESIVSKITLKKKSGPGEIVGVTEQDSYYGMVDFNGLQFTEPGDYVISVIPSSPDLEPTEITFKVEPADEVIEQEPKGEEEEPITGNRPIITQIDKPTIKLEELSFEAESGTNENKNTTTGLGFLPVLYYGAVQIRHTSITKLDLFYQDFVPKLIVTFSDTTGLVNSPDTTPGANAVIDLFFNSGSSNLKSIHLQFLIDQKSVKSKTGLTTIYGKLNLKDFYKIAYKSYNGTSFQTLRNISKELGLGFNSNITDTNDSMNWIRRGNDMKSFINDIIEKSYISDDSFMTGYIDYYWCFNYVDVEKEYNRDIENDVGIISTGLSTLSNDADSEKISKMILTNDKGSNSSPFYFSSFRPYNNSTSKLTSEGASTDSKVYDRIKKTFLKFRVDSLTSKDADKKILRSEDDINTNYRTEYSGKIDTDNVHENYLYAKTQNSRNFKELSNVTADLILPQPNFNIYKFQKIKILFINDKKTITDNKDIDAKYSGDWVIIDIGFTYNNGSLRQLVKVARKELSKTESEIENEVVKQDNSDNNEINENENIETTPTVPNSIYTVGQEVKIEQDGKMYIFVVDQVSDNGLDISGRILETTQKLPPTHNKITNGPQIIQSATASATNTQSNLNPDLKAKQLSNQYTELNGIVTSNADFDINGKVVSGVGTASLTSDIPKSKQEATKNSELDAIKKYKEMNE